MKEILIVGANAAGVSAATVLRSEGFAGIIRLVDAEPHLPYERPPLSKAALAATAPGPTLLREEPFYRELSIELLLGRRVIGCTPRLEARLDDGSALRPDAVILATGARARPLAIPGSADGRVLTLRSWDDARRIRDGLARGARVVVIGGGLIGAEVAASASERGCEVTWLERGVSCLRGPLGQAMAEACVAQHRARGVRVIASAAVAAIEDRGALAVHLRGGQRLPAELVIVGIGVEARSELAQEIGVAVDGGILIDEAGRTAHPRLFAAGDAARVPGSPRSEHWQRAIELGSNAARALLGHALAPPELPWFWSDQFDRHFEVAGRFHGADEEIVRGDPFAGDGSVFALERGRLVGVATCNRPREGRAAMRLIRAGQRLQARELADNSLDLRNITLGGAA